MAIDERNSQLINLTADIVTAHLANNNVAAADVPMVIQTIHAALASLGAPQAAEPAAPEPAVPVRASIKPDYLICLEDGKKLKMLKRHLMAHYGMTPADYRAKWNLPASYPMVAPNYAETRRSIAKTAGLGRKPRTAEKAATAAKPATAKAATAKQAAPKPAAAKSAKAAAKRVAKTAPVAETTKPAKTSRRKLGIAVKE